MTSHQENLNKLYACKEYSKLPIGFQLAGYAALIVKYNLKVPEPDSLSVIGTKHNKELIGQWRIFTPRHFPEDSLFGHLVFALKYEGINLFVLKTLFRSLKQEQIIDIITSKPTSSYGRRIWFLYEWLLEVKLEIDDAQLGSYVSLVNPSLQYCGPSQSSTRHRVHNNLPGTQGFCPMVRRTEKLEVLRKLKLSDLAETVTRNTSTDVLKRASAFLLLEDSKASFIIENESPPRNRIERWGKIIGDAGKNPLTIENLEKKQSVVLEDSRFVNLGCRTEGGFIGRHERHTREPVPVHISAKHQDVETLLSGLIATNELLKNSEFDAILAAAIVAFGFVFIHPFADGNGRIHRYLIQHVLAEKKFTHESLTLPVSYVILNRLSEYRDTLEHYSSKVLGMIEWKPTKTHNIEVLNDTIDLYRYFDATNQAEFLYDCVSETLNEVLPEEIDYLVKYDELYDVIQDYIDMPDRVFSLLVIFLRQNNGKLSKRALSKEFSKLTEKEVAWIETEYQNTFGT